MTAVPEAQSTHLNELIDNTILKVTFNQNYTFLLVGTTCGYHAFTLNRDGTMQLVTDIPYLPYEDVGIFERLFASSMSVITSFAAKNRMKVIHLKNGSETFSRTFEDDILSVKLNRTRIVVCLESAIYIFSTTDLKYLFAIRDIPCKLTGLITLSPDHNHPYLAYPISDSAGEIQIFDTSSLVATRKIEAHNACIAAVQFNKTGQLLATASTKGTVIRVHNVADGARLYELSRGLMRNATIYSMAFSEDNKFLASSSSTGTIHIFRLPTEEEKAQNNVGTLFTPIRWIAHGLISIIHAPTSEALRRDRNFAAVHVPLTTAHTVIGFYQSDPALLLFVAAYDGTYQAYEVNTSEGGECKQIISDNYLDLIRAHVSAERNHHTECNQAMRTSTQSNDLKSELTTSNID